MNSTFPEWDEAEKNFILKYPMIQDDNKEILSEVLSSAFLVFRNNQKKRLQSFCDKSLEYLQRREALDANEYFHEPDISDQIPSSEFDREKSRPDFGAQFCHSFVDEDEDEDLTNLIKERNELIINGIHRGDQKIFNELYEKEFPKVVRHILNNSGNLDQAKDIFQDSIVILMEKVRKKDLDLTCSIKTYLFSISRLLWIEQLRIAKKNTHFKLYNYSNASDITIDIFDSTPEIYDEVNKAIDQLSIKGRTLLECFYYKKMSCEEIAELLGYSSAASVRNQKYKYLEKIRKSIVFE